MLYGPGRNRCLHLRPCRVSRRPDDRKPHVEAFLDGSTTAERHWQRLFRRDSACRRAFTDRAYAQTEARGVGAPLRRHSQNARALDGSLASRGQRRLSRKGHSIPQRHGSSWPLWRGLPKMRRESLTHSLCGQRDQLLRPLPDWWQGARGPESVAVIRLGLAADVGGTGSAEAEIEIPALKRMEFHQPLCREAKKTSLLRMNPGTPPPGPQSLSFSAILAETQHAA